MSAIEHAMSLVGANREDMIYMARSCVDALDEDYDAMVASEQLAWQNAILVMRFREDKMSQDILERALGRDAYDSAVTKCDNYESGVKDPLTRMFGAESMDKMVAATSAEIERRCDVLGVDLNDASSSTRHVAFTATLADMLEYSGSDELVESLREASPPELWDAAMAWNEQYKQAARKAS